MKFADGSSGVPISLFIYALPYYDFTFHIQTFIFVLTKYIVI